MERRINDAKFHKYVGNLYRGNNEVDTKLATVTFSTADSTEPLGQHHHGTNLSDKNAGE